MYVIQAQKEKKWTPAVPHILLPLALQPFVGFGFPKQVIPSFPIRC
jgi:hypothetical protein